MANQIKYGTPSALSSNFLGATADSLANGGVSAFVTYDNSSNKNQYASLTLNLGSINPSAGGSILIRVFSCSDTEVPDDPGTAGGGDTYLIVLKAGSAAKKNTVPMIRLYPESMRLQLVNSSGVTLAASGNTLTARPYNDEIQ